MQISLQLKDSSCRPQQLVGPSSVKGNMAARKELSIEAKERIVKFIEECNLQWSVVKGVGCSQSALSTFWCQYKRNGVIKKEKWTCRL